MEQRSSGAHQRPRNSSSSNDGSGGVVNPAAVTPNPHYQSGEGFYAEIPLGISESSSGPNFRDMMKPVEYKHDNLNSVTVNGQTKSGSSSSEPYMNLALGGTAGGQEALRGRSPPMSDFDTSFYHDGPPGCCSKFTTVHVVALAISGLVYLIIGGVAGYFYAASKCSSSDCKVNTVSPPFAMSNTSLSSPSPPTPSLPSSPWLTSIQGNLSSDNDTDVFPLTTPDPYTMHCQQRFLVCSCGPFGGDGGRSFSDLEDYGSAGNVTDFTIRHNDYFVSSLSLTYGGRPGDEHGYTTEGVQTHVSLLNGERIHTVDMDFTLGQPFLTQLVIHTNLRVLGPYGGPGASTFHARGDKLLYVDGKAGPLVDQLTLYFNKCS